MIIWLKFVSLPVSTMNIAQGLLFLTHYDFPLCLPRALAHGKYSKHITRVKNSNSGQRYRIVILKKKKKVCEVLLKLHGDTEILNI